MCVPSKRLLTLVALGIIPAWLLPGLAGVPIETLYLAAGVAALFAACDALASLNRLSGLRAETAPLLRSAKHGEFTLSLMLTVARPGVPLTHVGLPFPRSLEVETQELSSPLNSPKTTGAPGSRFEWKVTPRARGSYALSRCFVQTESLFKLWDIRSSCPLDCEIRVYPNLNAQEQALAPLFSRRSPSGMHQVRQLGKGREFQQLRSYLAGDSFSDIYWKGTARRGAPVTMLHQLERTQEVYVVLDVSRRTARPLERATEGGASSTEHPPDNVCERFLQTALVLALAAEQQGDRIGLLTFSDTVHSFLRAGTGRAHFNSIREAMCSLEARPVNPDFQELFVHIGNHLRSRSLLIILTDLGEPGIAESFVESVQNSARKHVVLTHVLGSREVQPLFSKKAPVKQADQLYARLAGHLQWTEFQETVRHLRQSGIHLTSSHEEKLAPHAVSEYLKVKKRQLL